MANVDLGGQYKKVMKFFWDPEPENDNPSDAPLWCLGRIYRNESTDMQTPSNDRHTPYSVSASEDEMERDVVVISQTRPQLDTDYGVSAEGQVASATQPRNGREKKWPEAFLQDFESRFWFTYRSQFPPIRRSTDPRANASLSLGVRLRSQLGDAHGFTADTGWGCMIRSGQCVLANALAIVCLGRGWRRGSDPTKEHQLISLFADDPRAPYSLHRFVQHGEAACGKFPGEWFGPSATARCIEALTSVHATSNLAVYVTGDGANVYEDRILSLATTAGNEFRPTLLLIGTRLGIDHVNPVYWDSLRRVLQMPQSVGIAGGRPSASHYFVGVQSDHFFYLDPHQTRPLLQYHENILEYTQADIDSCHTRRLRRLHIEAMDPSMLIAFLFTSREEWTHWKESVSSIEGKAVFHLVSEEPRSSGVKAERAEAIDEIEILDEDD